MAKLFSVTCVGISMAVLVPFFAYASGTFSITPAKVELSVAPGETKRTEVNITNRLGKTTKFSVTVEDIVASSDPVVAVELAGERISAYTIKNFINISPASFELRDGEIQKITITVSLPRDVFPGGHYGAVLISSLPTLSTGSQTGASAQIRARLGATILVRVPGRISESGKLQGFSTVNNKKLFSGGPVDFQILFENSGNVHVNPYGLITVRNIFGRKVSEIPVEPWFVLPESERTRLISWTPRFAVGRYRAELVLNRGYENILDEKTTAFWIIPWPAVVLAIVIIIAVLWLGRRFVHRYLAGRNL